jgi:hypothetical protein
MGQMTRDEAIVEIIGTWLQNDGEFCASDAERAVSAREMREALYGIGVSDAEIDAALELRPLDVLRNRCFDCNGTGMAGLQPEDIHPDVKCDTCDGTGSVHPL